MTFKDQDIEALEFIKCFRSAGVSVDSLVDYMSLYQRGMKRERKRLGILEEERKIRGALVSSYRRLYIRLNHKN